MNHTSGKFIVIVIVAALLGLPAGLSAKERRGANIVVTKLDGVTVSGELVAVKPEGLLVFSAGTDVTVGPAAIRTVRLVRKSRALPLAIGGFVAGAGEAIWATQRDAEDRSTKVTLFWIGVIGGGQALLGLGVGLGLGADAVLPFAGEPDPVVQDRLEKLKARSREGQLRIRAEGTAAAAPSRPGPGPASPRPSRAPRFRFSLGVGYNVGDRNGSFLTEQGSWRAVGEVPPEEAGPFPATFYKNGPGFWEGGLNSRWRFGPIGAAYEWTRRWFVEVEWSRSSGRADLAYTEIGFFSTADGKTYKAFIPGPPYPSHRVEFDALLAGVDYRVAVPDRLSRVALEVGAAAGPGWFRITPSPGLIPAARKVVPAFRGRIAFDYFFVPEFSLGVFADFRYARAAFPPVSATGQVAFHDADDTYPYATEVSRDVQLNVPGRIVELNGATIGARITFRI